MESEHVLVVPTVICSSVVCERIASSSPDSIVALPHLTLPQIHAALSYYYAHKAELDKEWKTSLKKVARLRAKTSSVLEEKLGPIKDLHG